MGQQDTQVADKTTEPVSQPDDKQVAAPTNDNQQGDQDKQTPPDAKPKETEAKAAEDDAILPDEDEGEGDKKPESKDEDKEPERPSEADTPEEKARKEEAQARYWERQAKKKDEVIETLTEQLQTNYIDQGEDDNEKRIRSLEARDYVGQIREARSTLLSDNQRVRSEIPLYNPDSPEFIGEENFDRLMTRYARDNVITKPVQGADGKIKQEVVGYRQSLFEYFAEEADLLGGVRAPIKKETDKANMDASAETPGGPSPSSRTSKGEEDDDFVKGMNSVK